MKQLALIAALALAACGHVNSCPPPADKVQTVTVNIPVPVACVDRGDIPAEPPRVGSQVNGNAAHDLLLIAPEAVDLRVALETALTLLDGCSEAPTSSPTR